MKIPQWIVMTVILNCIVIGLVIEVFGILTQNTLASIIPPIFAAGGLILPVIAYFLPGRAGGSSTPPPIVGQQTPIKRRTFIAALTGLVTVDIGIVWLTLFPKSHLTFSFASNPTPTATPPPRRNVAL